MKKFCVLLGLCVAFGLSGGVQAQEIAGTWQGTIQGFGTRIVMTISKSDGGALSSEFFIFNHGQFSADATTFQTGVLKCSILSFDHSYEGRMGADGKSVSGTWTGSGGSIALNFERATKETLWVTDPTAHKVSFVAVEPGVKLEVLDWGGTGRPLVLLTGLGNNAHVFDTFAAKLIGKYHVYGITRRGFGASDTPPVVGENYSADRLGDDVISVMDQLKIEHPVLAAHSIGGEELTSIGSRHPERVAGLIYLDAGYGYALYPGAKAGFEIDSIELRRTLKALQDAQTPKQQRVVVEELLKTDLPRFEVGLASRDKELQTMPDLPPPPEGLMKTREYRSARAVQTGMQRYTQIKCPVLAIFGEPHSLGGEADEQKKAAQEAADVERVEVQAKAFEALGANVRVVRIPHADHYIFKSNEADVLREMNAFIATLP